MSPRTRSTKCRGLLGACWVAEVRGAVARVDGRPGRMPWLAARRAACRVRFPTPGRPARAAGVARSPRRRALQRQRDRLLEDRLDAREELGRGRAAQDPVVAGDRDVHAVADHHLAVAHHRLGLHHPDRQDRRLRRVDDRREARHPVHAEVGDRERRARQLGRADLAVAHLLGQLVRLLGDLPEALLVGVEDRRHDQRALARDRHADVDAAVDLVLAVAIAAVDEREVAEGDRAGLDDHVVVRRHRRVVLLGQGLELLAQLHRALHVDVGRQREVRDRGLRLGHPAGDDLLDPRRLLDRHFALAGLRLLGLALGGLLLALGLLGALLLALRRLLGLRLLGGLRAPGLGRRGAAAGGRRLDVGLDDAPAGSGALERGEVDALLARDRPPAVALGRRGALGLGGPAAAAVAAAAVATAAVRRGGRLRLALFLLLLLGGGLIVAVAAGRVLGLGLGLVLGRLLLLGLRLRGGSAARGVAVGRGLLLGAAVRRRLRGRAAALADSGDDLADGERRALLGDDLEGPVGVGLVRHRRLVGLDLDELLALGDIVAVGLEPLEDRALLHGVGQARHGDVGHARDAICRAAASASRRPPRPARRGSGADELALGAQPVSDRVALGALEVDLVGAQRDLLVSDRRRARAAPAGDAGRALAGAGVRRALGVGRRGVLRHGGCSLALRVRYGRAAAATAWAEVRPAGRNSFAPRSREVAPASRRDASPPGSIRQVCEGIPPFGAFRRSGTVPACHVARQTALVARLDGHFELPPSGSTPLLTAFLSDLHLGTRTRADLLRRPEIRARLMSRLRGCDQVVLLGDTIELRDRPLESALAAAAPFLRELADAVDGGRVVIVPGNHDHRLALAARELARERHPRGAGDLVEQVARGAGGPLGEIRRLLGTDFTVAYPGWRATDTVWATHGHYLDVHSAAPTVECAAAMLVGIARGRASASAWAPEDYEAVLAPTYNAFFRLAQRPRMHRAADNGKALVRAVETALGMRGTHGPPHRVRGADRVRGSVRLGGAARLGTAPGEQGRPGILPFARVLGNLRVEADHVLFGHTHRTGPVASDCEARWRTSNGTALWNTGSWVYEPAYVGTRGASSPYWPGTLVTVDGSGPPRIHRLLDRL